MESAGSKGWLHKSFVVQAYAGWTTQKAKKTEGGPLYSRLGGAVEFGTGATVVAVLRI